MKKPKKQSQAWTPEPWEVTESGDQLEIMQRDGKSIAVLLDEPEALKTGQRIAACVNALAGVRRPEAIKDVVEAVRVSLAESRHFTNWERCDEETGAECKGVKCWIAAHRTIARLDQAIAALDSAPDGVKA